MAIALPTLVMIAVALICLVLLLFTYVGYPALMSVLARLWPNPPRTNHQYRPTVSALIPVYNGGEHLAGKLDSVLALDYPEERLQILLFLDGCTDSSATIARDYQRRFPARIQVVESEKRCGKPTALNRMANCASGEVLLLTDVRQTLASGALNHLVAALADDSIGCASGRLVCSTHTGPGIYWRYESLLRSAEGRFRGILGATGPIYAVRASDFEPLPADTILDDVWIPSSLTLRGRRSVIVENALAFDYAFGDKREFGRKARTLAGIHQTFFRMPALLSPAKNPIFFETVCHKILRLLGPVMLVTLLVATLFAANSSIAGFASILVIGQLAVYGAALLGSRGGSVGRAARSFVVLNAAAVVGFGRFLTGRQRVTW